MKTVTPEWDDNFFIVHVCGRELGDMVGLRQLPDKSVFLRIGFNSDLVHLNIVMILCFS